MEHTFGTKCRLAPVPHTDKEDGMPPIEAQFFYSSLIPIDDPLSTSSSGGGADPRSPKSMLRPFGRGDNNTLEKAWLKLASDDDRQLHEDIRNGREYSPSADKSSSKRARIVEVLSYAHWQKHRHGFQPQDVSLPVANIQTNSALPLCCNELSLEILEKLQSGFCALVREKNDTLDPETVAQDIILAIRRLRQSANNIADNTQSKLRNRPRNSSTSSNEMIATRKGPGLPSETGTQPRHIMHSPNASDYGRRSRSGPQPSNQSSRATSISRHSPAEDGISGKPFIRVGSLDRRPLPQSSLSHSPHFNEESTQQDYEEESGDPYIHDKQADIPKQPETLHAPTKEEESVDIAVGLSRLHMVSLPSLQMKPIYWSPVNDVAVVTRATWFYRDTMLPVPPTVANQLEAGYHELRPWSETWGDEIRCAIDVGPLGEEKVSHYLWPKDSDKLPPGEQSSSDALVSSDPFCSARCFRGEAAAEGAIGVLQRDEKNPAGDAPKRPFANYNVIYKDKRAAFLLKPSLKPSAYYGRRPVLKITRGFTVGIPVVRGFDLDAWEHIHRKTESADKAGVSAARESHENSGQGVCIACQAEKDRGQVTELVLVAHGIGQKFAERVESFHFTHAINSFRRAVNVELGHPAVQQIIRKGQNGLMILPLNWRMGLSFEDGGPLREEDKADYMPETFGLKDIEPDTIPAVRSMMSDVMFDIPFYMSHHKGKMIKALVSEANRVYRLWCRNNPGFAENGSVHLIAHSLGSAMAIDILSRQPTTVPRIDLSLPEPETRFFEFDTKNLFLVGSPAGFFLLLEKGTLIPRRGRLKPGADRDDIVAGNVVGEAGTFGCLAVDNIYNILAKEDPIAYLLNGAVDPTYSSSLKVAYVPSTSASIFKSLGDAVRNAVPGMSPTPDLWSLEPERPAPTRLPSQLELEVHDFTREEVAEKKAFLLNDNGQIDWYLRSGGGPLEIQYLNMLSAHTSYWTNNDFIRLLCMEIGRKPGRTNTIPAMRAVKAAKQHLSTK